MEADNQSIRKIRLAYSHQLIKNEKSEILLNAEKQILQYFQGKRTVFDLPFNFEGTGFEKKVWNAAAKIPFGKTISYKELARQIGNKKAYRAVGNALGKNPIPIIIACHRVISQNGIGGFSAPKYIKKYLLEFEKQTLAKLNTIKD